MSDSKTRYKLAVALCMSVIILFVWSLVNSSGVVKGANVKVDERKESVINEEKHARMVEGVIVDSKDCPITVREEENKLATCLYPEAYSFIGYSSITRNQNGLRGIFYDQLFNEPGTEAVMKLTTDNNLQNYCYGLIGEHEGSVVVLENSTGRVLAMAGRANPLVGYNINEIDKNYEVYNQISGMFMNQALAPDTPGSVFKIVTSTALIREGLSDYTFYDPGVYGNYHNAGRAVYGGGESGKGLTLKEGFTYSVNTYFASSIEKLGAANLETAAKSYLIGTDIVLDMGTMRSNFNLEYYQDASLNQATAFGQGNTSISPMHMTMIMSCIMNDGEMMKPYVVESIKLDDKKTKYKGYPIILANPISKDEANNLKELLKSAAISYGLGDYGDIYAKTGTAQVQNGKCNHIYLLIGTEQYSIVISRNGTNESSHALFKSGRSILDYMVSNNYIQRKE